MRWFRRCGHANVRCVHGDEINARTTGWGPTCRVACLDCGKSLPGQPLPEWCWWIDAPHYFAEQS